jgi:hypothetical protein
MYELRLGMPATVTISLDQAGNSGVDAEQRCTQAGSQAK